MAQEKQIILHLSCDCVQETQHPGVSHCSCHFRVVTLLRELACIATKGSKHKNVQFAVLKFMSFFKLLFKL